jgi:hypothetical protein
MRFRNRNMQFLRIAQIRFVVAFLAIVHSSAHAQGAKAARCLHSFVSVAGLASILEYRAETAADAKKLAVEKTYDNSLLQEIQKENAK